MKKIHKLLISCGIITVAIIIVAILVAINLVAPMEAIWKGLADLMGHLFNIAFVVLNFVLWFAAYRYWDNQYGGWLE